MNLNDVLLNLESGGDKVVRECCQRVMQLSLKAVADRKTQDSETAKSVQSKLLETIEGSDRVSKETSLLASHALFLLLRSRTENRDKVEFLTSELKELLQKNEDSFRMAICYGFLHLNDSEIQTKEISLLIFDVVYPHCIRYTRNSYLAYKILLHWLTITFNKSLFWENPVLEVERGLQILIFSNWDNSIEDLAKYNAVNIFPLYLNIMKNKHDGFLESAFRRCVDNVCWSLVTKYAILAEICKVWDNVDEMTEPAFLGHIFHSLTNNFLRNAGTGVYKNIAKKLNDEKWGKVFGSQIVVHVNSWNESKNDEAIQMLFKRWVEPTTRSRGQKFLPFVTSHLEEIESDLYRMHVKTLVDESDVCSRKSQSFDLSNDFRKSQFLSTQRRMFQRKLENLETFEKIVLFLDVNANTDSSYLRNDIFFQFKTLFVEVLKKPFEQFEKCSLFLHDFVVNCFEIGNTYQRKIFGLNIYRIILCYTSMESIGGLRLEETLRRQLKKSETIVHLRSAQKLGPRNIWIFTDKTILIHMLRLVLDQANDVRQIAADLLVQFFDPSVFSSSERNVLWTKATNEINSSKFYEIESGATLFKVLCSWSTELFSRRESWMLEAKSQLNCVKNDILKACTKNSPFYGVMTVILVNVFSGSGKSDSVDEAYLGKLVDLLEDAVKFFLKALFTQSPNSELSSSFAEIGVAINESIKNSEIEEEYDDLFLSTAHQNVTNCIWRSLKVCSELAKEAAVTSKSSEKRRRCGDLIVKILTKCRLKGAIETAGVAMGNLCRHLCRSEEDVDLVKGYLEKLLKPDEESGASITRRGAGLAIMFHKIVANDVRKDRPLLHFALREILDSLEKLSSFSCRTNSNNDDPRVVQLHFLKNLVINKELLSHVIPYLEDVYLTALKYGTSQTFTIRNASLQLIGALIPRLSGQCSGAALEFGCGSSVNHLTTHYPRLTRYVLESLEETLRDSDRGLISERYNSVIHILTLLSKLSVGGCEMTDYSAGSVIKTVKCCLSGLFACPVAYVRALSAKAYAAFVGRNEIIQELKNLALCTGTSNNANRVHGTLLAFACLKSKMMVEFGGSVFGEIRSNRILRFWSFRCREMAGKRRVCFVVEKMLVENAEVLQILGGLENLSDEPLAIEEVESLVLARNEFSAPGFHEFVDELVKHVANWLGDEGSVRFLTVFLKAPYHGYGTAFLRQLFQGILHQVAVEGVNSVLETMNSSTESFFDVLHPEVVVALAECGVFNRRLADFAVSEKDKNRIISKSKIVRLREKFFAKSTRVHRDCVREYEGLTDLEKLLLARIVTVEEKSPASQFYTILLARDDVPQVREIVQERLKMLDCYDSTKDCFFTPIQSYLRELLVSEIQENREDSGEVAKTILSLVKVLQPHPNYPYDENDISLYRDNVKFLNSFYAELTNVNVLESKNVRFTMKIAAELQREMQFDCTDLESFLGTSCNDYLLLKKRTVLKILETTEC